MFEVKLQTLSPERVLEKAMNERPIEGIPHTNLFRKEMSGRDTDFSLILEQ